MRADARRFAFRAVEGADRRHPFLGILTGVRPIKLLRRLTQEAGEAEAADYFREKLLVSQEKTALA